MPNTSSYSRDLACFRTPQARRQPGKRFLRHPIAVSPSVSCSSCLPRPGVVVTGVTVGGPVEGGLLCREGLTTWGALPVTANGSGQSASRRASGFAWLFLPSPQ